MSLKEELECILTFLREKDIDEIEYLKFRREFYMDKVEKEAQKIVEAVKAQERLKFLLKEVFRSDDLAKKI